MVWVTPKEVSELMLITERAVRQHVKKGNFNDNYRYIDGNGRGRGGKILQILLTALPEYAQAKYYKKFVEDEEKIKIIPQKQLNGIEKYTVSQKEKGQRRANVIERYKKFEKNKIKLGEKSKTKIKEMFIELWNSEHPEFTLSIASLYKWLKKSKTANPDKLVDKRGGHNRGKSSIPEEMWDLFCKYYLRQTQPTIKSCYEAVRLEANSKGITIPSCKAFEYAVKKIPESILTIGREGMKAFEDTCVPYAERDYTTLESNELWVSDHHLWDVHVLVKVNGEYKKVRPWGSYWMDMRSNIMVSGLLRDQTPNSDAVLCSFAQGVKNYGIPKAVYLDNGKDYKALDLFNSDKDRTKAASLAVQMDLDVHYAIPYNAKAKPLERTFKTLESQFSKLFKSYLGMNAVKRPVDLKYLGLEEYPTLEEFKEIHDQWIEEFYNRSPHNGLEMNGKTPEEVFVINLKEKRTAPEDVLRLWLMRTTRPRKVHRNGVTIDKVNYYSTDMVMLIGKEVYIRYNPDDKEVVYIYDLNDNPLCTALKRKKMSFNPTKEEYKQLASEKKTARRLVKEALPNKDDYIGSIENIKDILEMKKEENEQKNISQNINPTVIVPVRNSKLEAASKRFDMDTIEKMKEDALIKQEEQEEQNTQKLKSYAQALNKFYEEGLKTSIK
ncbi:MAG: Mu transposase C-terminal domain-containing protein [Tepidibacter sp.]|jgi:hypothetical protein|uniref:DNA-binding domain-containing protein n=1 Tax=Tepidibacter sp. TaxID=2529387 RepID=UPI0025D52EDD|nr:DNA-binding domain-containing protein [Tepidibacter sp.]MCT4509914.1 Mu transposase C-terminal domain-containing protein [Tepidibacter sp.]